MRVSLKTRIWNTVENPDQFPELNDDDYRSDWVRERRDFGVAFSGGGTRSASATLGQLRGLREIGLLEKAGYISAVSGGSWAATPFTFLPENIADDIFLGPVVNPENLSMQNLGHAPEHSLAYAISHTILVDDLFKGIAGDETYARIIGRLFLKPFGLNDTQKFFTYDEKSRVAALHNNPSSDMDFYLARKHRPFLIVGGTLLMKGNNPEQRKMQVEYTPIYTGIRSSFPQAGKRKGFLPFGKKANLGGGYIETFAYDSMKPSATSENRIFQVALKRQGARFTLSDMIGSSGAAPEEQVHKHNFTFLGFPEFEHWSVHPIDQIDKNSAAEYPHGDGGSLENFGIMPLLARQVKKILVFINTSKPFTATADYTDDLAPLFGRRENVDEKDGEVQLRVNQVFAKEKLDAMIQSFKNCLEKGDTLIHSDEYDVLENKHYGIRPYRAKICWIYNAQVDRWRNAIGDESLKAKIPARSVKPDGEFTRFPHYRTFFENKTIKGAGIIDLTARQVNLLAHLSCWNVLENRQRIAEFFQL